MPENDVVLLTAWQSLTSEGLSVLTAEYGSGELDRFHPLPLAAKFDDDEEEDFEDEDLDDEDFDDEDFDDEDLDDEDFDDDDFDDDDEEDDEEF